MAAPPPSDHVERFRRDLETLQEPPNAFAVAVSGGPDSLALLLLAHRAFPGRIRAATVDHGLRAESRAEAAAVSGLCEDLGIPHRILAAQVTPSGEGVQSAARDARYAALAEWMDEEGLALLLTAHHCDDQAETLLMRLNRGSGVGGLAGVRASGPLPGTAGRLRLARPLLGWRRAELAQIVWAAGLEAADDPSNADERYDRARLRRQLGEARWLDAAAIARSAASLAEAEAALEWTAGPLFAARTEEADGAVTFRPHGLPPELLRRLVLRCLERVAPGAKPRGEQVAALIARLRKGRAATLCGVKAVAGETWRFEPAPPRR